jgi:hypothetical protein
MTNNLLPGLPLVASAMSISIYPLRSIVNWIFRLLVRDILNRSRTRFEKMPGSTFKKTTWLEKCSWTATTRPPPNWITLEKNEKQTTWQLGRGKIIWFFFFFFNLPVIETYTGANGLQRWRLSLPNIVFSWQLIRPLPMPEWLGSRHNLHWKVYALHTYISARAKSESFRFLPFLNWLTSFSMFTPSVSFSALGISRSIFSE